MVGIKYQESGIRKTNGGLYIKFGGSEAFALSEGLTNVKPKKFCKKFKLLYRGIKYQESGIRKTNGGLYIIFGGSEAFALSEGLTNV